MTRQMDDYAAQRSQGGWTITRVPCRGLFGGNSHIHFVDETGKSIGIVRSRIVPSEFLTVCTLEHGGPGLVRADARVLYGAPASPLGSRLLGARLVIALDTFQVIDPKELADEVHRTECDVVMSSLHRLVAHIEGGGTPQYDWPATDTTHCTVGTVAHFPGLLGLIEAAPMLRLLEARVVGQGWCFSSFCYSDHEDRRLAQVSLRRLGQAPRGYSGFTFNENEKRIPLRRPHPGPIDGRTRHPNLLRIRKGTPVTDVYELLGSPDEVGDFWRYDIDGAPSYTVLLWLAEDNSVSRIARYLPPF